MHGQIRTFTISACAHKVRVNPNIRLRGETSMCLSASKEGPDTSININSNSSPRLLRKFDLHHNQQIAIWPHSVCSATRYSSHTTGGSANFPSALLLTKSYRHVCATPNLNARAHIPSIFGTTTPIFSSGGNFRRYRAEKPNGVIDLDYQRRYRSNTYTKHAGPSMGRSDGARAARVRPGPYATL